MVKRDGALHPVNMPALTSDDTRAMAYSLMRRDQLAQFEATMECDLSYENEWGERFRVNVHRQRGKVGAVIRHVSAQIPTLAALGLPFVSMHLMHHLLALAVGQAQSADREAIRNALERLPPYRGVMKTYRPAFSAQSHDALDRSLLRLARFDARGRIVAAE